MILKSAKKSFLLHSHAIEITVSKCDHNFSIMQDEKTLNGINITIGS